MIRPSPRAGIALAAGVLVATVSCGRQLQRIVAPNQPPSVRIVSSDVIDAATRAPRVVVRWRASDADGKVDHFLVAVNPKSVDAPDAEWRRVEESAFTADAAEGQPLVVAVRAVDARGAQSATAYRSFLGADITPSVQITSPHASALYTAPLKAGQVIQWVGADPDGPDGLPDHYKYRFFMEGSSEIPVANILADPDLLPRTYAGLGYVDWTSTSAESPHVEVPSGAADEEGVLAVVAVDAEGGTTAPFSLNSNVLHFRRVDPAAEIGPRITVFNEWFRYTSLTATLPSNPPTPGPTIDFVAGADGVTVHWFAEPPIGFEIAAYRWALDLEDVFDETPRHNERDVDRWSDWNAQTSSAHVGPFYGPEGRREHLFLVEAKDNLGNVSLLAIRLRPVSSPLNRELLIVDDTRLNADRISSSGFWQRPLGRWPTAAELDTFLYARGGTDWNYAYEHHPRAVELSAVGPYPPGTLTVAGLFNGYEFDTIGTRTGQNDLTVPLETLLQYRHVVWITDGLSATNSRNGTDGTSPQTALRYMTSPGHSNTLAAYVAQGGSVWVLGGGIGYASSIANNNFSNDRPTTTFRSGGDPRFNELGPGRFMWDFAHWRSAFRVSTVPSPSIVRVAPATSRGRAPDFSRMPSAFQLKSPATDPLPPLRHASDFYLSTLDLEFLIEPNSILEDHNPSQPVEQPVAVLDSLYVATGLTLESVPVPVVTYYRGFEHAPVLFSGFNLWSLRRDQCQQMVDAVLRDLWRLTPNVAGEPPRRGGQGLLHSSRAGRPATTAPAARATSRR